jgi:hypothetical protein
VPRTTENVVSTIRSRYGKADGSAIAAAERDNAPNDGPGNNQAAPDGAAASAVADENPTGGFAT